MVQATLAPLVGAQLRQATALPRGACTRPEGSGPRELDGPAPRAGGSCTGKWRKDRSQCQSMDEALEAVRLPWLYRKAAGMLNVLIIEDDDKHFCTTVKAGGILDLTERFPWSGELVEHKRRDKRPGSHIGRVLRTAEGPQIQAAWSDPFGGEGSDTFSISNNGDTLTQTSVLRVAGRTLAYTTVYCRMD